MGSEKMVIELCGLWCVRRHEPSAQLQKAVNLALTAATCESVIISLRAPR
jgi:hypothetical protein